MKIQKTSMGMLFAMLLLPLAASCAEENKGDSEQLDASIESSVLDYQPKQAPALAAAHTEAAAFRGSPALCAKLARMCDQGNQNACNQWDRICGFDF